MKHLKNLIEHYVGASLEKNEILLLRHILGYLKEFYDSDGIPIHLFYKGSY